MTNCAKNVIICAGKIRENKNAYNYFTFESFKATLGFDSCTKPAV